MYADPELVTDPPDAAAALSPLLGIAASELEERMAKRKLAGGGPSQLRVAGPRRADRRPPTGSRR